MIGFWVKVTEMKSKNSVPVEGFYGLSNEGQAKRHVHFFEKALCLSHFCMYHQTVYGSFQIIIVQKLLLSILNWQGNDRILASIIPDPGN